MQLKTVGESLNVIKTIENLGTDVTDVTNEQLANSLKFYSLSAVEAAITQSNLTKEQIKAILFEQGLQGEILETTTDQLANAASTNAMAVSQKAATTSTVGLENAFKGLKVKVIETGSAIKGFLLTNPVGLIVLIVGAIAKSFGAALGSMAINFAIGMAIDAVTKIATSYSDMVKHAQEATKICRSQKSQN